MEVRTSLAQSVIFQIIEEDAPDADVVVVCCGGGGLLAGVATAIKVYYLAQYHLKKCFLKNVSILEQSC